VFIYCRSSDIDDRTLAEAASKQEELYLHSSGISSVNIDESDAVESTTASPMPHNAGDFAPEKTCRAQPLDSKISCDFIKNLNNDVQHGIDNMAQNSSASQNGSQSLAAGINPGTPVTVCPEITTADTESGMLPDIDEVLLVAPTGKAAILLGRRTGRKAYTLHQVIFSYFYWRKEKNGQPFKFANVRALVVDEASLVAVTTFNSLISILMKPGRHSTLRKLVILGDINQLPSIEPGDCRFMTLTKTVINSFRCLFSVRL
jgi:hypothetical protein